MFTLSVSYNSFLFQEVILPWCFAILPLLGCNVQENMFYFLRTSPAHRQAMHQLTARPSQMQPEQTLSSLVFSSMK